MLESPFLAVCFILMQNLSKIDKIEFNKLQKRLRRETGKAIADYNMIEDGDKVMVCLSGGKDSYTLLQILLGLQKSAPIHFEIVAMNLDQKQPGFPEHILPDYLKSLNIPFHIVERDTFSVVQELVPEGKTTCGMCSRLRRGTLYAFAESIGATKIALGHHRDDIIETLFLNMFHGSKLKAMPPKLLADSGRNVLIRPLAYSKEKDIGKFAKMMNFPIIPCNLCGSQENLQRQKIKQMLAEWEEIQPGRSENIFRSTQNVSPSQLSDQKLFNFADLKINGIPTSRDDENELSPMNQSLVTSWNPDSNQANSAESSEILSQDNDLFYALDS